MPVIIKKRILWFYAAVILLALGVMACQWLLARGRALTALEKETAAGLFVEWRMPSWSENQPYLAKLWPGSTLYQVQVDYQMQDAAALGDALRHFGKLQRFNIGQGKADEVHLLLSHCGEQPIMKTLLIFNVEIDDRILPVLAKWSAIDTLAMVPNQLTGEGFPLMPNLRSIDMSYSRVSDKGLVQLVESPKLEALKFSATSLTSSALVQAARTSKGHLRGLWLSGVYLKDGDTDKEREKLRETVKLIAPELQFGF
ncbi:MAG: hypothetical protein NTY98_19845 [Verrucomicrobia bacterium]|nr:hypothetical protein [Verrucomicrobiota bacterium]